MRALVILLLIIASSSSAFAHPGRTASDGCHYCKTRCDYWGVPWNERHCHGGSEDSDYGWLLLIAGGGIGGYYYWKNKK